MAKEEGKSIWQQRAEMEMRNLKANSDAASRRLQAKHGTPNGELTFLQQAAANHGLPIPQEPEATHTKYERRNKKNYKERRARRRNG